MRRDWRGTVLVWLGVVSHWFLDWITHRPDLALFPGGRERYGLALWNSVAGTMATEIILFIVGVSAYAQATKARDKIGRYAFWSYAILLFALYIGDRFYSAPQSVAQVAWTAIISSCVFHFWAWWYDCHPNAKLSGGLQ